MRNHVLELENSVMSYDEKFLLSASFQGILRSLSMLGFRSSGSFIRELQPLLQLLVVIDIGTNSANLIEYIPSAQPDIIIATVPRLDTNTLDKMPPIRLIRRLQAYFHRKLRMRFPRVRR